MIIRRATLLASAPNLAACPSSDLPEIAFIGRSNVGKSSLVNMLTRVKDLAKVSATPGKTRLINLFNINGEWTLVDLPGYGYAKVGREDRAAFGSLITDYIQNRPNLRRTFVLIDSRLTPQQIDLDFLEGMVHFGLPFGLIFTKSDKLSKTATQVNVDKFMTRLGEISDVRCPVITSSSKLSHGRSEILHSITAILAGASDIAEERETGEAVS